MPPNGRRRLVSALETARARSDELFTLLAPGALYERPIPERHRLVFYLGHLEAFDWNLLCQPLGLRSLHPTFDKLFAFGIDPPEGTLPSDRPSDWPGEPEVRRYNLQVRDTLDARVGDAPQQLLHAAIGHRLMHAETFAYLLHNLPPGRKVAPQLLAPVRAGCAPAPRAKQERVPRAGWAMIEIPAGLAILGLKRDSEHFGWDNEFEQHPVQVPAFAIRKHKVTNAEYLEFVEDGGERPHFWQRRSGEWMVRTMFGETPLPPDWPVYVTHKQAGDYAAWKGQALPSEAQFDRAAYGTPGGDDEERPYPWGEALPSPEYGNFDFASWDPVPVTANPPGDSAFGVSQLVGNGWEWTATVFAPFPGFQPFPFYPGYSANFFDGSHFVLKGGSARTAAALLTRSFRNWFRPRYPYVYATFRGVEAA